MNNLQKFLSNYVEFAVFTIYGNYVTLYLREMFPLSRTVEVHGSIFKEVPKSDDLWIAQVRFSGSNGTWQGRLFVPESGSKYYSRITEATAAGVYGRTSVTVM